jgi:hypothetical protein
MKMMATLLSVGILLVGCNGQTGGGTTPTPVAGTETPVAGGTAVCQADMPVGAPPMCLDINSVMVPCPDTILPVCPPSAVSKATGTEKTVKEMNTDTEKDKKVVKAPAKAKKAKAKKSKVTTTKKSKAVKAKKDKKTADAAKETS